MTVASARIIVTRPAREAAHWVEQLGARGHAATALPLIAIGPCTDPAARTALAQARAHLDRYRAAMFVSGNAADYFFDQKEPLAPGAIAPSAITTRAWAPGPGTVQALVHAGVPRERIDSPAPDALQFDSEALWQRVAPQVRAGDRILIVRGCSEGSAPGPGQGRDWLARQIEQAGATVDFVVAYTRGAPHLTPEQTALAHAAASDGSWWLLSSSEALTHLASAVPGLVLRAARALATHPRIAQSARAAGFGQVQECRPALDDVMASIESVA
ncbi:MULTISPECIES: uroporphyrinogen-III synthase [Comamonadaceae]|uniref:uroporphyrinogen-III synthase n=1 Tax=Comamonadaceae TaxID=80864 RepID=UPI002582EC12|nr:MULTISPECIES: uroporphyrinogen-III synthase [Comamonadaceae]MCM2346135.1 uroporphyrinogen-III synthase [Acidovorax soli]